MMPCEVGMNPWLAGEASELAAQELSAARVTAVDRGRYLVRNEQGEVPAELTGKLLHLAESSVELPCVGDWVGVRYRDAGSQASIHSVLPRRSFPAAQGCGRDVEFQMIAANVDAAFIVQSCPSTQHCPARTLHGDSARRPHRARGAADEDGSDQPASAGGALIGQIRLVIADARVVCVSNVTGAGVDRVRALMAPGKTYCLLGSSGVGRTTLINRLLGNGSLQTRKSLTPGRAATPPRGAT